MRRKQTHTHTRAREKKCETIIKTWIWDEWNYSPVHQLLFTAFSVSIVVVVVVAICRIYIYSWIVHFLFHCVYFDFKNSHRFVFILNVFMLVFFRWFCHCSTYYTNFVFIPFLLLIRILILQSINRPRPWIWNILLHI